MLKYKKYFYLAISTFTYYVMIGLITQVFPAILKENNVSTFLIAVENSNRRIIGILLTLFIPLLVKRFGMNRMGVFSIFLCMLTILIIPFYFNYAIFLLLGTIFSIGTSIFTTFLYTRTNLIIDKKRGEYIGILNIVVLLGMALPTTLLAYYGYSYKIFVICAILNVITIIAYLLISDKTIMETTKIKDFIKNIQKLLKDKNIIKIQTNYVSQMRTKEDWKDKNISQKIEKEYEKISGYVEHKKIGKIILTNSVYGSLSHFKTPENVEVLYNAPLLFKTSIILRYVKNWKNRGYDSYLCASIIKMKGKKYIVEMIINKYNIKTSMEMQKGYIINVIKRSEFEHHLSPKSPNGIITTNPDLSYDSIILDALQEVNIFEQDKNNNLKKERIGLNILLKIREKLNYFFYIKKYFSENITTFLAKIIYEMTSRAIFLFTIPFFKDRGWNYKEMGLLLSIYDYAGMFASYHTGLSFDKFKLKRNLLLHLGTIITLLFYLITPLIISNHLFSYLVYGILGISTGFIHLGTIYILNEKYKKEELVEVNSTISFISRASILLNTLFIGIISFIFKIDNMLPLVVVVGIIYLIILRRKYGKFI